MFSGCLQYTEKCNFVHKEFKEKRLINSDYVIFNRCFCNDLHGKGDIEIDLFKLIFELLFQYLQNNMYFSISWFLGVINLWNILISYNWFNETKPMFLLEFKHAVFIK